MVYVILISRFIAKSHDLATPTNDRLTPQVSHEDDWNQLAAGVDLGDYDPKPLPPIPPLPPPPPPPKGNVYVYVSMHAYMYVSRHVSVYVCTYVCMYVRMYVYMYCMYVCMYVCIYNMYVQQYLNYKSSGTLDVTRSNFRGLEFKNIS